MYGKNVNVYYVDNEGKLTETSHGAQNMKETKRRIIDERKGEKSMLKTYTNSKG